MMAWPIMIACSVFILATLAFDLIWISKDLVSIALDPLKVWRYDGLEVREEVRRGRGYLYRHAVLFQDGIDKSEYLDWAYTGDWQDFIPPAPIMIHEATKPNGLVEERLTIYAENDDTVYQVCRVNNEVVPCRDGLTIWNAPPQLGWKEIEVISIYQ